MSSTYRFHWSKSVAHLTVTSTPSPGMSVGPSALVRVMNGGDGCLADFGNVPAGTETWIRKLSHVADVQLCSVGGPYPWPVGSGLRPCQLSTCPALVSV